MIRVKVSKKKRERKEQIDDESYRYFGIPDHKICLQNINGVNQERDMLAGLNVLNPVRLL